MIWFEGKSRSVREELLTRRCLISKIRVSIALIVLLGSISVGCTGGEKNKQQDAPEFGANVQADVLPVLKSMPEPEYPAEARAKGIVGVVKVMVLVGKDGTVRQVKVEQGEFPELEPSAERAIKQALFEPATFQGKPVAVWVSMPVKFSLHEEKES